MGYGWRCCCSFYSMRRWAGAGYVVELAFGVLGLVPGERRMQILQLGVSWNYTTVLNIVALAVTAVLVWRFLRKGGPNMLRMMGNEGESAGKGDHEYHRRGDYMHQARN